MGAGSKQQDQGWSFCFVQSFDFIILKKSRKRLILERILFWDLELGQTFRSDLNMSK